MIRWDWKIEMIGNGNTKRNERSMASNAWNTAFFSAPINQRTEIMGKDTHAAKLSLHIDPVVVFGTHFFMSFWCKKITKSIYNEHVYVLSHFLRISIILNQRSNKRWSIEPTAIWIGKTGLYVIVLIKRIGLSFFTRDKLLSERERTKNIEAQTFRRF